MIAPRELRLGNWLKVVNSSLQSIIMSIEEYSDRGIWLQGNAVPNRPEQLEGIPLTPEILSKIGTEDKQQYQTYNLNKYLFLVFDGVDAVWFIRRPQGHIQFATTEFLHQLQNLYFSLTNSELEINL